MFPGVIKGASVSKRMRGCGEEDICLIIPEVFSFDENVTTPNRAIRTQGIYT